MPISDFHARYLAHELTKRCASDSVEKLAAVLSDAQVDLKLQTSEGDKLRCGMKHFEAIGVPFDVVVNAGDV